MNKSDFYSTMVIVLGSMILFSTVILAQEVMIQKVPTPIDVDGIIDDVWGNVSENIVENVVVGTIEGEWDHRGIWKALWDDDNFYLLVKVTDDELYDDTDGANEHDDGLDIMFDTDNGNEAVPDVDDFVLTAEWSSSGDCELSGEKGTFPEPFDVAGIIGKCSTFDSADDWGYIIELAIPLDDLGILGGDVIGFGLRINDDDDGDWRDSQIAWFMEDAGYWNVPSALADIELVNEYPSELKNTSFELPGTEKIKGWDGICSDATYTGLLYDIPGWSSDTPAYDSGVETGQGPSDGEWTAFLMAYDSSVYQLTSHVIKSGDELTLLVDAKNNWSESGTPLLDICLYYDDNGTRVPIASEQYTLPDTMMEYSVNFSAVDNPESVGHRIGIAFDNVNETDRSWFGLDNVRLVSGTTGVAEMETKLYVFLLEQNYPNPFNPETTIKYQLPTHSYVKLSVYNLLGTEVQNLVSGVKPADSHTVTFNGSQLQSGVYFYRLETNEGVFTRKLMLLK